MDNACIIGYGYVGRATAKSFGIGKYYDIKGQSISLEEASKCKYVFLCLPTPTNDNKCDTSTIFDVAKQIKDFGGDNIFINRSTVEPGTARKLSEHLGTKKVVSNPEFLSELTWEHDAVYPSLIIIGCDDDETLADVRALYESRWRGIQLYQADTITAETIKYALNTFFATKVVFANELFNYCDKNGINYETVREVLEFHPWGSKNHFKIWHKGGRGAGGACLEKDLKAFSGETDSRLLKIANEINQELLSKFPKTYVRNQ